MILVSLNDVDRLVRDSINEVVEEFVFRRKDTAARDYMIDVLENCLQQIRELDRYSIAEKEAEK